MKKLTFIEALKVNETRDVKLTEIHNAYPVGELKNSSRSLCDLMKCDFYTEPEKFEFECVIEEFNIPYFKLAGRLLEFKDLSVLVGKRTKVIVEVIEND
jgi:hypothetical protein